MTARPRRVVVVGGGPSGLAAAFRCAELAAARGEALALRVLELSSRAGGAIGTDQVDGFRIERGADGFITDKPYLLGLSERLGLTDRLVRTLPARQGAYVVRNGELVPIPDGFSMMAPTRLRAFLASPLLSPRGKARALLELAIPRGKPGADESLSSFVSRRFGREVLERLAQPLIGGIYGADPELLSLRATMPRFLDEEQASGSVTLGLRRKARAQQGAGAARGARYGLFASFDEGMQVLLDALVARLPSGALALGARVASIEPTAAGGAVVHTEAGAEHADAVIVALGAAAAGALLAPLDAGLGRGLAGITLGSAALVNLGYARRVLPANIDGYGVVIPAAEGRASIAATFASRKWPGRAPAGADLIRVFLGPALVDRPEQAQIEAARAELRALFGVVDAPSVVRVARYERVMPHYHVGHLDRAAAIEAAVLAHPWLSLAGNSLRGVGLPDAIHAGEVAAERAMGTPLVPQGGSST
jgi:protoporphyrinogen/coproporphyrinogen III oxidase